MPAIKTKTAKGPRSISIGRGSPARAFLWDMLTFDKLMTGAVTHLIYWSGMAIIAVIGFGMVGAAVGLLLRDFSFEGVALAIPLFVVGLLVTAALVLIWRGVCEFYLAVFRIAEDLRALRIATEAQTRPVAAPQTPPDTL